MAQKKSLEKKLPGNVRIVVTPINARGMVSLVGSIPGGTKYCGSHELASTHASMLLEGSRSLSKQETQDKLDDIGASLSFAATATRLRFSARVRGVHLKKLLSLIGTVLSEPTFDSGALEALKLRENAGLDHEAQDTNTQAHILFLKSVLPTTHPLYPETTQESRERLASITSDELAALHEKVVGRSSLVLSLAGDITLEKALLLVPLVVEKLPKKTITQTTTKKKHAPNTSEKSTAVCEIKNKESVSYEWGTRLKITNTHADYAALAVLTDIVGGPSFSGWLMRTVRGRDGLTYGIYARQVGFSHETDGIWYVWATFAQSSLQKGRAGIRAECKKALAEAFTQATVERHQEMLAASLKVNVSTSSAFSGAMHDLIVDEKPLNYLETWPVRIREVTVADVKRVAKKYLKLETFKEAAAGSVKPDALE